MAVTFDIQFRISVSTKVIRLTNTSSGFTFNKGCFKVQFPNGVVRNLPDFSTPDITTSINYIDIPCEVDVNGSVITGSYVISFAAIDNAGNGQPPLVRPFDFNWIEPSNGITNFSDVIIPEVVFKDLTSYSPIGSFTGALTRTITGSFPSTSEASANSPITSTSTNTVTVVSGTNYYEGSYTPTSDVSVSYTHTSNAWLTILYTREFSKSFSIRKCPNQLELVQKINAYRVIIDAYKETNDTQFNLLSEQYDLVIALYSHLIARFNTNTQDGSETILRELLSILEPYTGTYTYQSTKMLPFELTSSGTNSFNISDGTNTDTVQLGSTLTFSSGNASLIPIVTNNVVTYSPTFGTTLNTFAQGNDSRFHNPVTIGTANGLSISTQALSLAAATTGSAGAMSASDKTKLDGIASGATANTGTVTSVALTVPAAFSISGSPITTAGTLAIAATGLSSQYITGAGALATLNTANVPENTNLYFTTSRARTSISLTTTGTTGAATYDNATGILNIPSYIGGVTSFNTRTGAIVLSSSDVTTALTYTPYNATNPSGYISSITSGNVTAALGFTPENAANKGIANGYASLDGGGLVPSTQLPSYVDDVLEFANLAALPATGETGKIYVTLDTNKIYRWSGTTYIEVSPTVGTIWGGITGTLSNQTDLQNALNLKYNTPTGTTSQYVAGDGSLITFPVSGQSGTIVRLVRNTTGATLTKGTVVYISGATGNNPTVSKALATSDSSSAQTFGLCQSDIANNATGYVVSIGDLVGLDTSAFTEGQQLYLSGTTAGTYTATKQYAPIHLVYIGVITRSHPTQGQIEVRIQNGYELDELHDVSAQSPANNDIIAFNTTSGLWEKKSIATTLGYTPSNDSLVVHLAGTETITGQKTFNPSVTAASAIARGTNLTPTLVASANSDVLVGLDINPTFTNGSFTRVQNFGLRVEGINIGRGSGNFNTNTVIGYTSGQSITTGAYNTIIGSSAGNALTTASDNSIFGVNSGLRITGGGSNTLIGSTVGINITTGYSNSAFGKGAGLYTNTGYNNIFFGANAGANAGSGSTQNQTTYNSVYIGFDTRASANGNNNELVIAGYNGTGQVGLGSNTTIIGNSSTVTTAIYGNLLLGTTTASGYKLDVVGTTRIQDALTLSGSVTGVGNISNYTVTASSGSAKSKSITSTLIASANNDVLVGLDINPTFTNGSFTGVSNYALRVQSALRINGQVDFSSGWNFYTNGNANFNNGLLGNVSIINSGNFSGSNLLITTQHSTGKLILASGANNSALTIFSSSNITLQNGGTFTDAGYRLDVAGTTRFQGTTASDTAPLGSELAAVTGSGTNWSLAGTNLNVGGYTHTVGSVVPLTTSLAAVSGTYYQITYTITGRTAGSITIAYGGTSTSGITATGNTGPLASSTAVLTITPTTDFDGTVVLSIKSIGTSSASSTFANSSGTGNIEVRASSDVTNTFIGLNAGSRFNSTTTSYNTFIGQNAGQNNTTGSSNIFVGSNVGSNNNIGFRNVSVGGLNGNTTGSFITAIGYGSLDRLISGSNNVALGYLAGRNISGGSTNSTIQNDSIFIGSSSRPLADSQTNQIVIGSASTGLGSNTTVLGNSSTTTTAIYGNLLLGSTTDNGNKLQVTGAISASGNISGANIGGSSFSMNFGSSFNYGVGYLKSSTNGITVSTSATTIYTSTNIGGVNSGNLVLVSGVRVGNGPTFTDLILYMNSGSISVISSQIFSTPPSRNYSVSNENLTLSMASGSYIVACVALNQGYTNT